MKATLPTPSIAPIYNLSWYHMMVYKLFFKLFIPVFDKRLDIVLLFKRHIDEYINTQRILKNLPKQTTFDIEDSIRK